MASSSTDIGYSEEDSSGLLKKVAEQMGKSVSSDGLDQSMLLLKVSESENDGTGHTIDSSTISSGVQISNASIQSITIEDTSDCVSHKKQNTTECYKCHEKITWPVGTSMPEESQGISMPTKNLNNSDKLNAIAEQRARVWEIIKDGACFEEPICKDCAEDLLVLLEEQSRQLGYENRVLKGAISMMEEECHGTSAKLEKGQLYMEIEDLKAKIKEAESEKKALQEQCTELETEWDQMQADHQRLWIHANALQEKDLARSLDKFYEGQYSLDQKGYINLLSSSHVLNDLFHIGHDGPFGTINSFRLGKLPTSTVTWEEVNTGLGQCLLLLYLMAKKMNHTFENFRLIPMGSSSLIDKLPNDLGDQSIEQHERGKSGASLEFYFDQKSPESVFRWNQALLAFLDCMRQFGIFLNELDTRFQLPYTVDSRESIGQLSILYPGLNANTIQWVTAMKYMVTNLKWCLAFVSTRPKSQD
jgi:beclin 1